MSGHPTILVSGLDARSLLLEAPVLRREGHPVAEAPSARDLMAALGTTGSRLVVLGTKLDAGLVDVIRKIRASAETRRVSVLALIPTAEASDLEQLALDAGANAVLRRPLERDTLETWIAKLLAVARRIEARVPVQGQVVGTEQDAGGGHFVGQALNISSHGMLLASPVRLGVGSDLDIVFSLPTARTSLKVLSRVVREAPEVGWPYIGYGIEFLFVPPEAEDAIGSLDASGGVAADPVPPPATLIRSTIRSQEWVFELYEPRPLGDGFQVEIRRSSREGWRPGSGGPFYVVEGATPQEALRAASEFVSRFG